MSGIDGVGATRAVALHKAGYSSADDLRKAPDKSLLAVPGIGAATLKKMRDDLSGSTTVVKPRRKKRGVPLNADAQPLPKAINARRRIDRGIQEMLGLARGIIADGVVTESEGDVLWEWIEANPDIVSHWPANRIEERLLKIYEDGRVDDDEREDLKDLVEHLVGEAGGTYKGDHVAAGLPLDNPPPPLRFDGQLYVFSGKFTFGPRKACQEQVEVLGGMCGSDVSQQTNFLVVGTFGSRDWAHSSFGRKIQKAVRYRAQGVRLAIVGEDHWAEAVGI